MLIRFYRLLDVVTFEYNAAVTIENEFNVLWNVLNFRNSLGTFSAR